LRVPSRRFSVDEANRLIPRLEMLVERLQRSARTIRAAYDRGDFGPDIRSTADVMRVYPELAPHMRDMDTIVAEIEDLGCQFKGVDLGLVDFPGELDGRPVLLCWQYGEKSIGFWHAIDEGFACRRPFPAASARPRLQ
jgi:hypothetical protein